MPLNSIAFFLFLAVVLLLYYLLPRRAQNPLLLAASYLFYGLWDYRFLALLAAATLLAFFCGQAIARTLQAGRRKAWLALSLAGNLGALAFFKYAGFFVENAARVLGVLGLHVNLPTLNLLLPVGISFYLFQTISYTVDVYRGALAPTRNLVDFALYVAYFPKLLAGPIERAGTFLPQIAAPRPANTIQWRSALALVLVGLFKKVAIADPLSVFIDPVFMRPSLFSSPELLRAALFFTLQIYADFSGYTDIARGASRLLGIELAENFRQPYLSPNITLFWRRWHISLSSWLRDYLYIPLGGNRQGKVRTYIHLMLTMLLGGLWHGASWNFVIWGGLHGGYLAAHRLLGGRRKEPEPRPAGRGAWRVVLDGPSIAATFALVTLAWVFFRAWGAKAAFDFLQQLASLRELGQLPMLLPSILIPWAPIVALDVLQQRHRDELFFLRWQPLPRAVLYAVLVLAIILGAGIRAPFIYTQF